MQSLIGISLSILGLLVTRIALRDIWYGFHSWSWSQAAGKILMSDLEEDEGTYRAKISYRYSVGGREFVADRAHFGDQVKLFWSMSAQRLLKKYRSQAVVEVWYCPTNPELAVLQKGLTVTAIVTLAFGLWLSYGGISKLIEIYFL